MSKFNNKGKAEMPELNTSSLPDLIFSILFFFMIVTSMREEELKVEFKAPSGTELSKIERKRFCFKFQVLGFRFEVSGFGFQV